MPRSKEIDKITGLENWADDYLTPPFGIRELTARTKAMLRRSEQLQHQKATKDIIFQRNVPF